MDTLQPRNDIDIDVFQLHSISTPSSTVPTATMKVVTQTTLQKPTSISTGTTVLVEHTSTSPKASDILSRLISDMPVPNNQKNFVVFAPVADTPSMPKPLEGRRFDDKVLVHAEDDLVAEESSISEEISQDTLEHKIPFSRKKKSSRETSHKSGEILSPEIQQNHQTKLNRNRHHFLGDNKDSNSGQNSNDEDRPPPTDKFISTSISNRSGGLLQSVPNMHHQLNQEYSNTRGTNKDEFKHPKNINSGPQQTYQDSRPLPNQNDANKALKYQTPSSNLRAFRNPGNNVLQNYGNNAFQSESNGALLNPPNFMGKQQLQQSSPTQQRPTYQNQQNAGSYQPSFQTPSLQGHPSSAQNYQSHSHQIHNSPPIQTRLAPPLQSHNLSPPQGNPSLPHQIHNSPPIQTHLTPPLQSHKLPPPQNNPSPPLQGHTPPPQGYNAPAPQVPLNQGPSRSTYNNNPTFTSNSYPMDNSHLSSNGPQYFAPPPQTFHTKTSYDRPSNKFSPGSSMSSYERVAQSAIDQSKDGLHHHHHHHHHHEPIASNSDPIGDINLSDVPRSNDADRLGTIGLGLGGPRGITVQIGGGSGGGGLTGLLPMSALGIAKNLVASLLPRPVIGLNSKVFLGVEVGRGSGLNLLG